MEPKENIAPAEIITINNNYYGVFAHYVPDLSNLTNLPYLGGGYIYDIASQVPTTISNGVGQVILQVTDKPEIKSLIKRLDEKDVKIMKLVGNALSDKICILGKLGEPTQLTFDCNVIDLEPLVTFDKVDYLGRFMKTTFNSCRPKEEALSMATILKHDEIRDQVLQRCLDNEDAKFGLFCLAKGHGGEAGKILDGMVKELFEKINERIKELLPKCEIMEKSSK